MTSFDYSPREVVRLEKVTKKYAMKSGDVAAVKGLSLSIHQGEWVSLVGPSGSGKSTLMHLMGLLDAPSEGSVFFEGEETSQLSDEARSHIRGEKVGFVFQSFNLIPQLTVLENVLLAEGYRKGKGSALIAAEEALDQVGILHRKDHLPSELSGGELQRGSIARAIVGSPSILFADEPTGNLDQETGRSILRLFDQLSKQGTTLVIVTHDEAVARLSERRLALKDGDLVV